MSPHGRPNYSLRNGRKTGRKFRAVGAEFWRFSAGAKPISRKGAEAQGSRTERQKEGVGPQNCRLRLGASFCGGYLRLPWRLGKLNGPSPPVFFWIGAMKASICVLALVGSLLVAPLAARSA